MAKAAKAHPHLSKTIPASVRGIIPAAHAEAPLSPRHSAPPRKPDWSSFALIAAMASSGFANAASGTAKVVTVG
jgi:hypothetical protein